MNLAVDVISDLICPWCYIGKRRLEKAVTALDDQHEVWVRWLPFQLNPAMPKEGISRRRIRRRQGRPSYELSFRASSTGWMNSTSTASRRTTLSNCCGSHARPRRS